MNDDNPMSAGRGTTYGSGGRMPYREYVLVNELMIESWSARTDTERAAVDKSARAIEAFADWVAAQRPAPFVGDLAAVSMARWSVGAGSDPLEIYETALVMPNELYRPELPQLRALVKKLRGATVGGVPIRSRSP